MKYNSLNKVIKKLRMLKKLNKFFSSIYIVSDWQKSMFHLEHMLFLRQNLRDNLVWVRNSISPNSNIFNMGCDHSIRMGL